MRLSWLFKPHLLSPPFRVQGEQLLVLAFALSSGGHRATVAAAAAEDAPLPVNNKA